MQRILSVLSGMQGTPVAFNIHPNLDGGMLSFTVGVVPHSYLQYDITYTRDQPHWPEEVCHISATISREGAPFLQLTFGDDSIIPGTDESENVTSASITSDSSSSHAGPSSAHLHSDDGAQADLRSSDAEGLEAFPLSSIDTDDGKRSASSSLNQSQHPGKRRRLSAPSDPTNMQVSQEARPQHTVAVVTNWLTHHSPRIVGAEAALSGQSIAIDTQPVGGPSLSPELPIRSKSSSSLSTALSGSALERLVRSTSHASSESGREAAGSSDTGSVAARPDILNYEDILPNQVISDTLDELPADQKTATNLFRGILRPGDLGKFDSFLKNHGGIEAALQNFQEYAKLEDAFLRSQSKEQAKTLKKNFTNQVRKLCFPELPSQAAALFAIGEENWTALPEQTQTNYLAALADFDAHLARKGKNMAASLHDPEVLRDFISEKQKVCEGNANMKGVLRMWRAKAHRLPLDDTLNVMIDQTTLSDDAKKAAQALIIDFSEYAYTHNLSEAEFLQALQTAKSGATPTFEKRLIQWTGAGSRVATLITHLISVGSSLEQSASKEMALSVIDADRFEKLHSKTKTEYLFAWTRFDVYLKENDKNLDDLLRGPDGAAHFLIEMHAFCKTAGNNMYVKSAFSMWRKALFSLELEKPLAEIVDGMKLTDDRREDYQSLVASFAEFACVHGLSKNEFLQQLPWARTSNPSLQDRLIAWTGQKTITTEFIGGLARELCKT